MPEMIMETSARPSSAAGCDLCGEHGATLTLEAAGRYLVKCNECGLVRQDPMPTVHELRAVYDTGEYYTQSAPSLHHSRADSVRNAVLDTFWHYPSDRNALLSASLKLALWPLRERAMPVPFPGDLPVLDIGCGNGQRLLELKARGCTSLYGVEPTTGAAERAREATGADIRATILEDAGLPEGHFKLIIMNQVLEHVPSPTATLRLVRSLLRPDGALYFTVPNYGSLEARLFGQYWSGLQLPAHLHHFTPEPLRELVEGTGFRVTVWRTDTVAAITAASVYEWCRAHPRFPLNGVIRRLPRAVFGLPALAADLVGMGQMLRVVATRQ